MPTHCLATGNGSTAPDAVRSPKRLLVTADSGGGNSSGARLWRVELQRFADETGLIIEVCHYPPGTSKWNENEHRLLCHIRNRQAFPSETLQIVTNLIGSTRKQQGLEAHAALDESTYERGRKVTAAEMSELHIKRNKFHGDWNHEIRPRTSGPELR